MKFIAILILLRPFGAFAQEAASGFELRTTLTAQVENTQQLTAPPRVGSPYSGGFRAMFYPTWKLSRNWALSGAIQIHSRPYFYEEFATQGYGIKTDILQSHVSYSRLWSKNSFVFRAGFLSSAFGSFLLRYDDAANPLIDMPMTYGYYYKGISNAGLPGVSVDASFSKLDLRAQFVNSSPANRRGIFDHDQYGNWAAGAGYTLRQGFRIGVSAYRGPYLHRQYAYFYPGEANPRDLPATALGVDGQWGMGQWNVYGEWQHFNMAYKAIPTFIRQIGYGEVRRGLHPRWYAAARLGYTWASYGASRGTYEGAIGYRPNAYQLVKVGYEVVKCSTIRGTLGNTFAVQIVSTFKPISVGRD